MPEYDPTCTSPAQECSGSAEFSEIERQQLGAVWSRVVLGGRVEAPDSDRQTPEEFRAWLHESLIEESGKLVDDWDMMPKSESLEQIRAAASPAERARAQEAYIQECQKLFTKRTSAFRPASEHSTKWDSWPGAMRESGEFNCAGAVFIGTRLLDEAGLRQWIGNPVGHVVNVAQLADGSMWYIDFLNRNIHKIAPTRTEIAGIPAFVLVEEGIEYRRILLRKTEEATSIILDNLSSMQHTAHEADAASHDPDAQTAVAYVKRFPGLLDTIDLEPLSTKLGGGIHAAMETAEMRTEKKRVQALHSIGDDPRLIAFRDALGDASAREAFRQAMQSELEPIRRFLEGDAVEYATNNALVRRFAETARDVIVSRAKLGTELYRELVEEFVARMRRVPPVS